MATNPLKKVSDINKVIKLLLKFKADSVIAVNQLFDQHPARIKKIKNGKLYDFSIKEKLESGDKILSQMLLLDQVQFME